MVNQLIPLGNRIVVLPIIFSETIEKGFSIQSSKRTEAGLFIPTGGKGDAFHGKIVAVGRGYVRKGGKIHPMDYEVGDIVLYGRGCGEEYFFKSKKHLILSDDNILAIYKGKKDFVSS